MSCCFLCFLALHQLIWSGESMSDECTILVQATHKSQDFCSIHQDLQDQITFVSVSNFLGTLVNGEMSCQSFWWSFCKHIKIMFVSHIWMNCRWTEYSLAHLHGIPIYGCGPMGICGIHCDTTWQMAHIMLMLNCLNSFEEKQYCLQLTYKIVCRWKQQIKGSGEGNLQGDKHVRKFQRST